ncbi:MAG TPA: hypothetical protein VEH47_08300 [Candidatus Acidoferrales bacterium]|nr:hypothetical protein [Candidatus Acidoferrales bacterium]
MPEGETRPEILIASLARLWPNRQHESNWLKSLACRLGMHRWQELDIGRLVPNEKASFCRWCTKIRFRGAVYE